MVGLGKVMKSRNPHAKQSKMWLRFVFIIFLNTQNVVDTFNTDAGDIDPEEEWDAMESLTLNADEYETDDAFMPAFKAGVVAAKPPSALQLPESLRIPASQLRKDLFIPEKGYKPLPPEVTAVLLPVATVAKKPAAGAGVKHVEVLCYLDRMYVRVRKSLFTDPNAWKTLKLGTCAVNKATSTHYYFLYYLKGCGLKRGEDANRVTYTNALYYKPVNTGPIVRSLPFTMPIRCTYTKFRRSYQVGFLPKITGGTVYRGLQSRAGASLTAMDASWKLLPVGTSFMLGQAVCFEAKGPSSGGNRLYLNSCYVTSSPNPTSTDQYAVVANSGCLVDSKTSALTKFYTTTDKTTARLCFAAFLFKNMVSKTMSQKTMFMHCELYLGPEVPTPSAKSCTFNLQTKKWTELYGDAAVCDCCSATCPAPPKTSGKSIITSKSWDLKLGPDPSAAQSRLESIPEFSLEHDDFELFWESDEY